mgnify:CR=1 FL=1
MQKNIFFAFLLLSLSSLFWSGNFLTGKLAFNNDLSPFKLSFFRWLLAFIILLPFTAKEIFNNFSIYFKNIFLLILLSILGIAIFNSFTYISLRTTFVINSSLMTSITPVLIIFFSWLIFKVKTTSIQFTGIFLSLFGSFCIVLKGDLDNLFNLHLIPGDIWMFIAVFCWSLYSVLLKKIDKKLSQLATLQIMIFIGLIFISPFYFFESLNEGFYPKKNIDYYMIFYVSIFAGVVSFFFWNKGVLLIGPSRAGFFLHLIPIFSSIWAIFFLNEIYSSFHIIGAIFIVIGIILANIKKGYNEKNYKI